ncbi:UNVERIFIED_CONTAM: hypothetical protein LK11_45730 [Mumia flava]
MDEQPAPEDTAAVARFQSLCIDVTDARAMAPFWAAALGLTAQVRDDGQALLRGATPEHTVWINEVPEPRTVKQRVHLDVHAVSVAEYERLGARVLPAREPQGWTVMADPEGGELCVFERDDAWWDGERTTGGEAERDGYRLYEVVVDAADARRIADWWAGVLGVEAVHEEGASAIEPMPGAPFACWVFGDVPEPKTVKNRIHPDLTVDSQSGVDELVRRGATVLRRPDDEIDWTVMADPEGNEFVVFVDESAPPPAAEAAS